MLSPVVRAAIVAFIASFCTLVIELVAGRVLAPYVGVSLYTWTSIIGVVLAGISGGAYAGGWLADRRPVPSTLGWLLLAAGSTAILIVPATSILASIEIATTLLARVVLLSVLLFFLPAFFLGMISPVAVKLAVRDVATAGTVVGRIYALSTLGSIAGTFVTGFWLVARFGTRATLAGTGVTLIATALLFGGLFGRVGRTIALLLLALCSVYAGLRHDPLPPPHQDPLLTGRTGIIHREESQYYTIQVDRTVREDTGAPLHALHLDHLVHSYTDLADPAYLEYGYLQRFHEVIETRAAQARAFRLLFIGGGGYTLPRLVAERYPEAEVEVVEIDAAVTRVAHRFFGLRNDTAIRTIHEDARWFAMRETEPYDVIFIDAFNDLSVPYHLTTRELTARLQQLLTQDGALVVNLIDDYRKGRFLASYARTLQSVFGERNVAVLMDAEEDREGNRSTFVVVACRNLGAILPGTAAWVLPHDELQRYLANRRAIVLTDDYAPVDNMLAPLFRERFAEESAEE